MKKIRFIGLFVIIFLTSNTIFAQGIPKPSAICDSLMEEDINSAFALSDAQGALFEAFYKLGVETLPQSKISVLTTTEGTLTVVSVGGKFPEVTGIIPIEKWFHSKTGCPTLAAVSVDEKTMVRLIYEQ